ncbi:MAG: hypothetical protein QXH42_08305, partial [Thermoplasmata archaeon]
WDRTTTDDNGSYAFTYYHGNHRILVRGNDNYDGLDTLGITQGVWVYRGTELELDFYLMPRPTPSKGNLTGRVLDMVTGEPLSATLNLGGLSVATDENGVFTATLPRGVCAIEVSSEGYLNTSLNVSVPWIRTTHIDFYLVLEKGTGNLSGVVLDRVSGRPVGGASISLYSGYPEPLFVNTTTDAAGAFGVEAPSRSYTMLVGAEGYIDFEGSATVLVNRDVSRKIYMTRSGEWGVLPPEFELVSLPGYNIYFIGEPASMEVRVRNIGDLVGKAEVNLTIPGIYEENGYAWVPPGEEAGVFFNFTFPDDLEERGYKAFFTMEGVRHEQRIIVRGMKVAVNASLDRNLYRAGDVARLSIDVANLKAFDVELFSRVKYGSFDEVRPFNLSAHGNTTLVFDVPVVEAGGEKLFYSVYTSSGRSLYINSLYVRVRPAGDVVLTTDKQVYEIGEEIRVTAESTVQGLLTLRTPWYSGSLSHYGTTTIRVPVPELRSGTYHILYSFDGFNGSVPFDVSGYSARFVEAQLEGGEHGAGETLNVSVTIEANRPTVGRLVLTVYDPQGNVAGESEVPWNLSPGENRGSFSVPFNSTDQTGIHSASYTYLAELAGNSTPLAAGSRAFDAVDELGPGVLNVTPSRVTEKSVTLVIYTTEKTLCSVEYGQSGSYGRRAESPVAGRVHSVTLTNLSASKTYHYRLNLTDMSGNSVVTQDLTVRTPAPTPTKAGGLGPVELGALVVVLLVLISAGVVLARRRTGH